MLEGRGFDGTLHWHDDHVTVGVDGGSVAARYVIAADGCGARCAGRPGRRARLPRRVARLPAVRQRRHRAGRRGSYVWFDEDFLPGYAWSFPLPDGRANVGFGVPRDGTRHGKDMRAQWAGLLDRPHIRRPSVPGVGRGAADRWPIPARADRAVLATGRVLLTGDAAAATDVMTGEGIGQALLTGRLAAEAVLAGGARQPDLVAGRYEHDVRHHLLADHRMSARPRARPGQPSRRAAPSPSSTTPAGDGALRQVDVRGRAARPAADAVALAPPVPPPARRASS